VKIPSQFNKGLPEVIEHQTFNEKLKILAAYAGLDELFKIRKTKGGKREDTVIHKYELMSAHTGRRTFATTLFKEDGLSLLEIAKLTGHTSEKNLLKYIKVTPEEASNHLRAIWAKKKK
jgi:integrase